MIRQTWCKKFENNFHLLKSHLDDRFVGTPGNEDRQEDADDPPDGREDGHGEDRGPHDPLEEHTQFIVILTKYIKIVRNMIFLWHIGNLGEQSIPFQTPSL